jgi:hypothetical protein
MQMISRSIAIQPSNSLPPSQRKIEMDVAFQSVMGLMILSTIAALIYACIYEQKQHSSSFKLPFNVPCPRCRYFSNNSYLKCTLHPVTALTEQAIDCRDYCPHREEKRIEKESTASWRNLSWRSIVTFLIDD